MQSNEYGQQSGRQAERPQASNDQTEYSQASHREGRPWEPAYADQMNPGELYGPGGQYGRSAYATSDYGEQSSGQGYASPPYTQRQQYGASSYSPASSQYGQGRYPSPQPQYGSQAYGSSQYGQGAQYGLNAQRGFGEGFGSSPGYGAQGSYGQQHGTQGGSYGGQSAGYGGPEANRDRESPVGGMASQTGPHDDYGSPYAQYESSFNRWRDPSEPVSRGYGPAATRAQGGYGSPSQSPYGRAGYQSPQQFGAGLGMQPSHGSQGYGHQGSGFGASQYGPGYSQSQFSGGHGYDGGYSNRSQSTFRGDSQSQYDQGSGSSHYAQGGYSAGQQSQRGRGPKNYVRSDERIVDDLNERLMNAHDIDVSDVEVRCESGRIVLDGTVDQRWMKHRVEDIAESCAGVRDIDNRIRVASQSQFHGRSQASDRSSLSGSSASASSSGSAQSSSDVGDATRQASGTAPSSSTTASSAKKDAGGPTRPSH